MTINSAAINAIPINGTSEILISTGSGSLVDVEQQVIITGSGSLVDVEQQVSLLITGSGSLVDVEQQVIVTGSGSLVDVEQQVNLAGAVTFHDKNGWDWIVTLGGYNIPREQLFDTGVIHHYEGDSAQASFTIIPGSGTYDLYDYQGKSVTISAKTDGNYKRLFTGVVDIPVVDLIKERIKLNCVSDRTKLINSQLGPFVADFGSYSTAIHGTKTSVAQEIEARLSTVPKSLDFDGSNNWTLTDWTPKTTPDFTLGNSDIFYRDPTVRIESGKNVVNKYNISFAYQYQRSYQQTIFYSWTFEGSINNQFGTATGLCDYLNYGLTVPKREMVRGAAASAGWTVSNLSFSALWPAGWYYCGTTISEGATAWTPWQSGFTTNSTGVTANGNEVKTTSTTEASADGNLLCIGAGWHAKKRFTQNITESYTIVVENSQSQALYGTIENDVSYTVQDTYDAQGWENKDTYDVAATGVKVGDTNSYYINNDTNPSEANKTILAAVNTAKTALLATHRDSEISYETPIDPYIELKHTVGIDGKWLAGKGKVKSITHKFNATGEATTAVTLALYRAISSTTDTAVVAPSRPSDGLSISSYAIGLGSRYGYDASTHPQAAKWVGYMGSSRLNPVQQSFVVDTPPIAAAYRDNRSLDVSATYSVNIPSDSLQVKFLAD